jgi:hypothetical protein
MGALHWELIVSLWSIMVIMLLFRAKTIDMVYKQAWYPAR